MIKKIKSVFTNQNRKEREIIKDWQDAGQPVPPPHIVKQNVINELRRQFDYRLFIETGTYLGDMVEAQKRNFKKVISIELGEQLYLNAVHKFKNDKNITILQGDSGTVLIDVCAKIEEPAIFWLDGHYSGGITALGKKECPIFEELNAIFVKQFNHVLLIDDARLFVGANDYPTIEELSHYIKDKRPAARISIEYDIIHVIL